MAHLLNIVPLVSTGNQDSISSLSAVPKSGPALVVYTAEWSRPSLDLISSLEKCVAGDCDTAGQLPPMYSCCVEENDDHAMDAGIDEVPSAILYVDGKARSKVLKNPTAEALISLCLEHAAAAAISEDDATEKQRAYIRERYAATVRNRGGQGVEGLSALLPDAAAVTSSGCCDVPVTTGGCCDVPTTAGGCCDLPLRSGSGAASAGKYSDLSLAMGYAEDQIKTMGNLGLGCGNPFADASVAPGETVVDLGSGAGFDCLLAANLVGPTGSVIGVDMTPDMVAAARRNVRQHLREAGRRETLVSIRLGEIEHLPVSDASVDCVISNCVINLSMDQSQVYREIYRVLRSGGRLCSSDVVRIVPDLPDHLVTAEAQIA
uniref:Arsenite methyltransferase n=1 Tax=Corethron hystrix TaxID=216773 RepID=A0A7S1BB38_9STRA